MDLDKSREGFFNRIVTGGMGVEFSRENERIF